MHTRTSFGERLPRTGHAVDIAGWCVFAAVAALVVLVIAPRRGVDFSDEGWVLSASLHAARSGQVDLFVPQAPMWVVNALAMRLGLDSYLSLRLLFYWLVTVCCWVGLAGITRLRCPGVCAGLACLAPLTALSTIASYNNLPPYLFFASAGLLLLAVEPPRSGRSIACAVLAGALLALAGFLNFTLYPAVAMFAGFAVLALAGGRKVRVRGRPGLLWLAFGVAGVLSVAPALGYIAWIGTEAFFDKPPGHHVDFDRVVVGLRRFWNWVLVWGGMGVVFTVVRLVTRRGMPGGGPRFAWPGTWVLAIFAACMAVLAVERGLEEWESPLVGDALGALHAAGLVSAGEVGEGDFRSPPFAVLTLGVASLVLALARSSPFRGVGGGAWFAAVGLAVCFWLQHLFSLMESRFLLIYSAGGFLAIAMLLLAVPALVSGEKGKVIAGALLLVSTYTAAVAQSLLYVHPLGGIPDVQGEKVAVGLPRLEGLLESPERAETLRALARSYEEYGVADRTMLTFNTTALLHFVFAKAPVPGLEYFFYPYSEKNEAAIEVLERSGAWAVYVSWNGWRTEEGVHEAAYAAAAPLLEYLERRAERVVVIGSVGDPTHPYDDFVLYLGGSSGTSLGGASPEGRE